MKKAAHYIKSKLALVAVVVAATAVGGVASTVVSAAIPDGDGVIHGCYRNNSNLLDPKGALKIIDAPSDSCAGGETALSWAQNPPKKGYGHIIGTYNDEENTWSLQTDTGRTSGLTSIQYVVDSESAPEVNACITVPFNVNNISITGGNSFPPNVAVRTNGLNAGDNGWSSPKANTECGTSGANAFIRSVGFDTWFTLH